MGAWGAAFIVTALVASTAVAAEVPTSRPEPVGGWSSFMLDAEGDAITFILSARVDGAGAFGVDLYSADRSLLAALRVSLDGRGRVVAGEAFEQEFDLLVRPPPVLFGSAGSASVADNGLHCRVFVARAYPSLDRYEMELRECAGLSRAAMGIGFGAATDLAGWDWRLELAEGSKLDVRETVQEAYALSLADFDGDTVHVEAGVEFVHAPGRSATLTTTDGFTGAFIASSFGDDIDHGYASARGAQRCACLTIAEPDVPGARTFTIDTTSVSGSTMFVLAGVDARLPP